ncbi:MAG: hypothetical protein WCD70_01215 [Alphaproteobacteria bacterium]
MTIQAKGQRGSWFANADGENLPCVHKHWWKGKAAYYDPGIKIGEQDCFVNAIQEGKRVILTDDNVLNDGGFERTKYIAVYDVDNFRVDETGLYFDFKKRIKELK